MDLLNKLYNGKNLTFKEAGEVAGLFLEDKISDIRKAAFLTTLKLKGETPDEIAGFASTMRKHSVKINSGFSDHIDVCGTGGDDSGTFNISTIVSFVVAAAGVKIAKHGNRSISSKSGSADVLKLSGIKIDLSPHESEAALQKTGIAFLFAPVYHPAMKNVANVRKELGTKTIFNMLGPLTNPAGTKRQLIGTFNEAAANKMAMAAAQLDMDRIDFICTEGKYDEVTLTGDTSLLTYIRGETLQQKSLSPSDFGYGKLKLDQISGGGPEENAEIMQTIFESKSDTPHTNVVCANASLAFIVAGKVTDVKEGVKLAEETLFSGAAYEKFKELKSFGSN